MKLEKFNYNSGKRSKWFLYGFIMCAVLMVLINLFFSHAKYLNKESIKLAEGNISYKPYDFKIMAMYQENDDSTYSEIEKMPTSGYVINEEKSYCTIDNVNKDSNVILKTIDNNHTFSNLSKNDKCYLYFDIQVLIANDAILANKTIRERTDFSTTLISNTTGAIYQSQDDAGTTYYYAGAVTDNYVKFAGFYWRIIRINGDKTIRLILQDAISQSPFNTKYNDNMYVGFMYASGEVHGRTTNSTIKTRLEDWYTTNIVNNGLDNKIASGGGATFCNDRQVVYGTGVGTTGTNYIEYNRIQINKNPTYKCTVVSDRFDTKIGLITADEVAYAGGVHATSNTNYYLYTGRTYWTMTPQYYHANTLKACVSYVNSTGGLNDSVSGMNPVTENYDIRPVINLKSDTSFSSGTGTISNPYIVS